MLTSKIYAGIVTFNPEIIRLKHNIDAISPQLKEVVLFDNGSKNIKQIKKLIEEYNNVFLIEGRTNKGIAVALNVLMKWGYNKEYQWMLSLDQDSVCHEDFVKEMSKYLMIKKRLGIVAPVIKDRNVGIIGHNPVKKIQHVNTCITSGAFSNLKAWKQIGGYDERMFIDSVDFEYCYRMRKNKYGVIQVRDVQLLHEIGASEKRRFLFWKVIVNGHSAFRKFYIAQNNVYYPLKHHLWLHFLRGNFRNFGLMFVVLLYEDNKKDKLLAIIKGWIKAYQIKGERNYAD